ncbi:MAG: glycosyltransferase family 2 protein [Burkholderiales bacterium]|nr:glycosyltransferase family 2 protein [Burkholderiales bacterium]
MSLSVIIIAKNEAKSIGKCLESVSWADEIVVIDSGSTDETVKICESFGAKIQVTDWPGFGPQKNRALDLATGVWILSLDADEIVTPELKNEILGAISGANAQAYSFPRSSSYCGRFMRHGGWWPDRVTRLFRKNSARFSDDLVHEKLIVDGKTGVLSSPLIHIAFSDLEEVLQKIDRYSTAGAIMMAKKNKKASLADAIFKGMWAFFRTYVLRGGFLDGKEGFMLAISNAEGTYYRYLKLMLMSGK